MHENVFQGITHSCYTEIYFSFVLQQEPEREKKTRIILDTLNYRGLNAAEGLYYAFLYSNNEELVELLAPYIRTIKSEDNTCILTGMYFET